MLAGFSVVVLGLMVSWLAAALLAFTIFFYVVVYTMWLKRSTPQNIVIGGAAGAFPPVIGWAAVTGAVSLEPVLLFLIIFFWTPPHFWALALLRADDYARAGVPMLPVVAGRRRDAPPDPRLFGAAAAGRRGALAPRLRRACLWCDVAGRRCADGRVRLAGLDLDRRRARCVRCPADVRLFDRSISSCLFAVLLVESVVGRVLAAGLAG